MKFWIIIFIIYWGVPIASLLTVALSAIALASPNSDTLKHVALLTIASPTPDGPRVWLGLFSSCAQGNSQLTPICTGLKMHPEYDFSVFPESAPTYVFTGPSLKVSKRLAWVSITITGPIFTLLALWIPLRGYIVQLKILQRYLLEYPVLAWIGGAIGIIGGLNFWVLELYMKLTCQHFNEFVRLKAPPGGPELVASIGGSFKLGYIGHIMFCWAMLIILLETSFAQSQPPRDSKSE